MFPLRVVQIRNTIHAKNSPCCHSERSEESLLCSVKIKERFLASLGMTASNLKYQLPMKIMPALVVSRRKRPRGARAGDVLDTAETKSGRQIRPRPAISPC